MKQLAIKTILFALYNAPSVGEQIEQFLDLIARLKADYANETSTLSVQEPQIDTLADQYPEILNAAAVVGGNSAAGIGDRMRGKGAFGDLIRYIIENPEQFQKWFELAKTLFGLEVQTTASTSEAAQEAADCEDECESDCEE